jgi:hypothetical protein
MAWNLAVAKKMIETKRSYRSLEEKTTLKPSFWDPPACGYQKAARTMSRKSEEEDARTLPRET